MDLWALGIIMHMVLTGNQHPFYKKGKDSVSSFKEKLASLKKIEPHPSLSWLAKNLFLRLTTVQSHQRYQAKDALKHPWITRNQNDRIPKSIMDEMTILE